MEEYFDFDYYPYEEEPQELLEYIAFAGESLENHDKIVTEPEIVEALKTIYDPEIPVNIYDLGLIYTVDIDDIGDVKVGMSLTAPGCPVAGEMPGWVSDAVAALEGAGKVETKIVWEPSWNPDMMSDDAKMILDIP